MDFRLDDRGLTFRAGGVSYRGGRPGVNLLAGHEEWLLQWRPKGAGTARVARRQTPLGEATEHSRLWKHPSGLELTWIVSELANLPGLTLRALLDNGSDEPIRLREMVLLEQAAGLLKAVPSARACDVCSAAKVMGDLDSIGSLGISDYMGLYTDGGQRGVYLSAVGPAIADIRYDVVGGRQAKLDIVSEMTDIVIEPGQSRASDEVLILALPHRHAAELAFRWLAALLGARTHRRPVVGWCSWYDQFGAVSGQHVLDVARACAGLRDRIPMDVIQIDEGYQRHWGDWRCNEKFADGWKPIVDAIRQAGATPGIWIAPLGVHDATGLHREHPDWFQTPVPPLPPVELAWNSGTVRYLDPTHPQAQEFIRRIIRDARGEGFEYFKIDFNGVGKSRFFDSSKTRLQALRGLYELYRQEMGEAAYLNACIFGISRGVIGLADAARVGGDSAASWSWITTALNASAATAPANGIVLANDPDVSYVRPRSMNRGGAGGQSISLEELRSWHGFVGLLGGFAMMSEPFFDESYRADLRMLEILTPPAGDKGVAMVHGARMSTRQFGFVARRSWGAFAAVQLFNPDHAPQRVALDLRDLSAIGERFHAWSFWDEQYLGVKRAHAAALAPHASQLLRLTPCRASRGPVLLGSTLHLSMGAAEVTDWRYRRGTLEIHLAADAGARQGRLHIHSKAGLSVAAARGCSAELLKQRGDIWVLTLADRQRQGSQVVELNVAEPAAARSAAFGASGSPLKIGLSFDSPLATALPGRAPAGVVRLEASNPTDHAVESAYELRPEPKSVRVEPAQLKLRVEAHAMACATATVFVPHYVPRVHVRALPADGGPRLRGMTLLMPLGGKVIGAAVTRTWQIPRFAGKVALREVDRLLGEQPYLSLVRGDRQLAKVRAGLTADALVLHAVVSEPSPAPANPAWTGSSIEVFGAAAGDRTIGQVVIQPAAGGDPARAWQSSVQGQSPADDVAVATTLVPGGYELRASIPLSRLAVKDASAMLLEVQATIIASGSPLNAALFGSEQAYCDSSRYARIV